MLAVATFWRLFMVDASSLSPERPPHAPIFRPFTSSLQTKARVFCTEGGFGAYVDTFYM